jgi:hypothetical protein
VSHDDKPEDARHFHVDKMFSALGQAVATYDELLARMGFVYGIDEIAYLFPTHHHAEVFIREAVHDEAECTLFNVATDHVHTSPINSCYDVMYQFLSVPSSYLPHRPSQTSTVRIEAMHLARGFSPLHFGELLSMERDGLLASAIHASFKCEDETAYAAATHRLRESGWEVAQRCDSTYGRFSYWKPLEADQWLPDGPFMYLKPRINLRDAE